MLPALAAPGERHRVSALGYSLGYLGGGTLFLVNVVMFLQPALFGLADGSQAVRASFLSVAVWWLAFSLPLLLRTPTAAVAVVGKAGATSGASAATVPLPASAAGAPLAARVRLAFRQLLATLRDVRGHRNLWLFLLAYWLYIDGVATIIRMAVDYGVAIGLPANSLIVALLLVQFVGFPATLAFGTLGERFGAKPALVAAISVYVVATVAAVFMTTAQHFYILACTLGLVQGGVQSLSRSMFSRLIPEERAGEYFGFLNMLGKAAAVVGPVLVGTVAAASGSPRHRHPVGDRAVRGGSGAAAARRGARRPGRPRRGIRRRGRGARVRALVALGALLLVGAYAMLWPGLTEPMLTLSGTVEKAKLVEIGRDILRESETTSGFVKSLAERMLAGLDASGTVSAFDKTNSILGTARTLADGGNRFVAVLILTFSVAVPVAKGLVMLGAALARGRARATLLSLASAAGKWSMADVFVIAIFIAFLGGNGLSDARGLVDVEASLGPGFSWFLGYCLLSGAASQMIAYGVGRAEAVAPPPGAGRRPAPSPAPVTAAKAVKKRKPVTADGLSSRVRRSAR